MRFFKCEDTMSNQAFLEAQELEPKGLAEWLRGQKVGWLTLPEDLEDQDLREFQSVRDPEMVFIVYYPRDSERPASALEDWYVVGHFDVTSARDVLEIQRYFKPFEPALVNPTDVMPNSAFKVLSYKSSSKLFEVVLTEPELLTKTIPAIRKNPEVEDCSDAEMPNDFYTVDVHNTIAKLYVMTTQNTKGDTDFSFYVRFEEGNFCADQYIADFHEQLEGEPGQYVLAPRTIISQDFTHDASGQFKAVSTAKCREIIAFDLMPRVLTREIRIENLLFYWGD